MSGLCGPSGLAEYIWFRIRFKIKFWICFRIRAFNDQKLSLALATSGWSCLTSSTCRAIDSRSAANRRLAVDRSPGSWSVVGARSVGSASLTGRSAGLVAGYRDETNARVAPETSRLLVDTGRPPNCRTTADRWSSCEIGVHRLSCVSLLIEFSYRSSLDRWSSAFVWLVIRGWSMKVER